VYQAQKQNGRAIVLLDRLLAEQPGDTGAMMARAILFTEMNEPKKAIPLLEEVVRRDRTRQRTGRYQLGKAYELAGRPEDARRVMEEVRLLQEAQTLRMAVQSQPVNLDLMVRAAEAMLKAGDTDEGLELLGKVLDRDASFAKAHRVLADHYERKG